MPTNANAINYFSPAKWVVSKVAGEGTHTTIGGALAAASTGDTIIVMPGTYTENNTISTSVNISAYTGDGLGNVIVNGTFTVTAAITVYISNLELQTNSAALLAVTGSAASIVNLINCYLNCSNTTGITYSSSGVSSAINLYNCGGNLGTTGISYHAMTSEGTLSYYYCNFTNTGSSITASNQTLGVLKMQYCEFNCGFSTSGNGANFTQIDFCRLAMTVGMVALAMSGASSGANVRNCYFSSGGASAITTASGATVFLNSSTIESTANPAISNLGALNYSAVSFLVGDNTTISGAGTQVGGTIQGGVTQAPSSGFLGEQIRAAIPAIGGVTLSTGVAANVANISLTPGIWDVSCIGAFTGTLTVPTAQSSVGIGIASATFGAGGDSFVQAPLSSTATSDLMLSVPSFRLTLTATTTIYLVVQTFFSAGTAKAYGRISATRVG